MNNSCVGGRFYKIGNPRAHGQRPTGKYAQKRKNSQPLEYPSAGSSFKRYPGRFTGQMIEEAGLKGLSVGDAEVSVKHAGFIVNRGRATCRDVMELVQIIKEKIYEKEGVKIECEIRYLSPQGEKIL